MQRKMAKGGVLLVALGTGLMAGPVARAQESSFSEVLLGDSTPLTIKVGGLNGAWRLISISSGVEAPPQPLPPPVIRPAGPDPHVLMKRLGGTAGVYLTQGRILTVGGDNFLVAYKMDYSDKEFDAYFEKIYREQPVPPVPTKEQLSKFFDTVFVPYVRDRNLNLTLLNLRQVGSLREVRPFALEPELAAFKVDVLREAADAASIVQPHTTPAPPVAVAPAAVPPAFALPATTTVTPPPAAAVAPAPAATVAPPPAITAVPAPAVAPAPVPAPAPVAPATVRKARNPVNDLNLVNAALQIYVADHGGVLPPMTDAATALQALFDNGDYFGAGNAPLYAPNPILSEHKVAHISNPQEFVTFYEVTPAANDTRVVLFLDGHVERITAADWPHFKKASKMP